MGRELEEGPQQRGPHRNTNIHPSCPPGYSVAVGEFSGDDTEGECVSRWWPKEGMNGDPGPRAIRTKTPFWLDSPFPSLSPQPSLLFADFVAGVPKGNLTYGYVRPDLPALPLSPSPPLANHKEPCTAVCEVSKSGSEQGLRRQTGIQVLAFALNETVYYLFMPLLHSISSPNLLSLSVPHSSLYNGIIIVLTSRGSREAEMR